MSEHETAIAEMHDELLAANGEDITVLIGDDGIDLQAIRGRTSDEGLDAQGLLIEHLAIDFIVKQRDLVIGEARVIPPTRSRVIAGNEVFDVLPVKPTGKAVEQKDPYGVLVRIHTKRRSRDGGEDALAAGGHMRVDPIVRTIESYVATTIATSRLRRIESVEVWMVDGLQLRNVSSAVSVTISSNGTAVIVESGVRLANARIVLLGT